MTNQSKNTSQTDRGRGALILVLGILSVIMFGFLSGIPAWVMGHTDLRRMREGSMDRTDEGLTRAGMILGIIGTVLSALVVLFMILIIVGVLSVVGTFLFEVEAVNAQERAIEAHIEVLAREARAWRQNHGSYAGFEIPADLGRTPHERYTAQVSSSEVVFRGRATNRRGAVEATLDSDGLLASWRYSGAFADQDLPEVFERILHSHQSNPNHAFRFSHVHHCIAPVAI